MNAPQIIAPKDTRVLAKPTCGGPVKLGQYDKYLIEWEVIEDGPYKGLVAEQKMGLDEQYIDKTFENLNKLGIDESNVLTAQPTRTAMVTLGVETYTNRAGKEITKNIVRFFDVPRAGGVVDAGLKQRLLERLSRRKGGAVVAVDPSPFDDASPLASPDGSDVPF